MSFAQQRREREAERQAALVRRKTEALINTRRTLVRGRWKTAIQKVLSTVKTAEPVPLFPIDNLQDFKVYFEHPVTKDLIDLPEPVFIKTFLVALSGRMRTYRELKQRFNDIDVNVDGTVSWDEFTSFGIHQAASVGVEDTRSKEFIYNAIIGPDKATEHKDLAQIALVHERFPDIVTSGFDGLIKFWDKHELTCTDTLSTLPGEGRTVGTSVTISPIVDLSFNQRGTVLFSCGVDKRVLAFDAASKKLSRGFVGTISPAAEAIATGNGTGGLNQEYLRGHLPSDITALRCMDHPVSGFHVGYPEEREVFFFGLQSGEVLAYVSMRHAMLAEVPPLFSVKPHKKAVSKVRYYPSIGVISCSWDHTLKVLDAQTGELQVTLGAQKDGHSRAVLDFDFNPVSRVLASVGCDRHIYLWNPYFDSPLAVLKGHTALLKRVRFNQLDGQLITLDQDFNIKTWDMRMYKEFQTISPAETMVQTAGAQFCKFSTLCFDPETSNIITCGTRPFSWTIRRAMSSFPNTHQGHTENVFSIKYIKSTQTIVTNDFNTVMTWNVATGRRTVVFDPNPTLASSTSVSAVALDSTQRRLLIGMKDATLKVFNPRNSQLLKELQPKNAGQEPLSVVHLTNTDETSKMFAFVFPNKIVFMNDIDEPQDPSGFLTLTPTHTITSAASLPSQEKTTMANLVVGNTMGQLVSYSSMTGMPMSTSENPQRPPTRVHTSSRQGSRGSRGARGRLGMDVSESFSLDKGSKRSGEISQPIEDTVYLPRVDLFAVVCADSVIHFWDLRRNELKLSFHTNMTPSECLLCVSTEGDDNKLLVTSCDMGCVYVRDISKLHPALSGNWTTQPNPSLPLLHTFRAHAGPVTQLQCVAFKFIVTLGTDCFIKLWTLAGDPVGYFGQKDLWELHDSGTYHACTAGDVAEDPKNPQPKPIRPLTRQPSTPIGGGWGQGRLNSRGTMMASADDSAFLTQGLAPVTLTSMSTLATSMGLEDKTTGKLSTLRSPQTPTSASVFSPTTKKPVEPSAGEGVVTEVLPPRAAQEIKHGTSPVEPPLPSFVAAIRKQSGVTSKPVNAGKELTKILNAEDGKDRATAISFQSAISLQPETLLKHKRRLDSQSPGRKKSPPTVKSNSPKRKAQKAALPDLSHVLKVKHKNEDADPVATVVIPSLKPIPKFSANLGAIPSLADPAAGRKMKPLVDREKGRNPGAPLHFTDCADDLKVRPLDAQVSVVTQPPRAQSTEPLSVMLKRLEKEAHIIKQQSIKEMSINASLALLKKNKHASEAVARREEQKRLLEKRAPNKLDPDAELEKRREALNLPRPKESNVCELHKSIQFQAQLGGSWQGKKQAFAHEKEENISKARMNNTRLQEVGDKMCIDPKTWTQRSASLLLTTKMDAVSTITDTTLKKFSLR